MTNRIRWLATQATDDELVQAALRYAATYFRHRALDRVVSDTTRLYNGQLAHKFQALLDEGSTQLRKPKI